jgi:hypothetical protein
VAYFAAHGETYGISGHGTTQKHSGALMNYAYWGAADVERVKLKTSTEGQRSIPLQDPLR